MPAVGGVSMTFKRTTLAAALVAALSLGGLMVPFPTAAAESRLQAQTAKAEKGDAEAAYWVANAYWNGEKVKRDPVIAMRWYRQAAEGGQAKAAANLGVAYMNGEAGFKVDLVEARRWLTKGAEGGAVNGMLALALIYGEGRGVAVDKQASHRWRLKAAEAGDAEAISMVIIDYQDGRGVAANNVELRRWLARGGVLGNADAMASLAGRLIQGDGQGPVDPKEGVRWMRMAAMAGHQEATFYMSLLHANGEFLPEDIPAASAWMEKARALGFTPPAAFERFLAAKKSKPTTWQAEADAAFADGIRLSAGDKKDKVTALAFPRFLAAADLGHPAAMYMVGLAYDTGSGIAQDKWQAGRWYLAAALAGEGDAMLRYAMLFGMNGGLPEDQKRTQQWLRKAAAAGHPTAIEAIKVIDKMENDGR